MTSRKAKGKRRRTVREYLDGDLVLSRCACGSTERGRYFKRETYELPPGSRRHPQTGLPVTHVVYRYTRCKGCKRYRRDRQFENRVKAENPQDMRPQDLTALEDKRPSA